MDSRLKVVNHVVALLQEALEVAEQIRNAPESPVTSYLSAALRRVFVRNAKRLRLGKLQPRYANLFTPEELAAIYELTAARDRQIERGLAKLKRITEEIDRVIEYRKDELEAEMRIVYAVAQQRALEDGPDSKAGEFFRVFNELIVRGAELRTLERRQKDLPPQEPFILPGADPDRRERAWISAAEVLHDAPQPDERVLHFAADTVAPVEPPVIIRIGIDPRSWVGSFQRGTTGYCTVQLMPDGAHLLVVIYGAGYIIEAVTRSLARVAGTDIVEVTRDEAGLFIIERAGGYLETYGTSGLLATELVSEVEVTAEEPAQT